MPTAHAYLTTSQLNPSLPPAPSTSFPDNGWFMDSGVTHHLTPDLNSLSNPVPFHGAEHVTVGNGMSLPIAHIGNKSFHSSSTSPVIFS